MVAQLETELKNLEVEKGVVELYQSQGKAFLSGMERCEKQSKRACKSAKILNKAMVNFTSSLDALISATEQTRSAFVGSLDLSEKFCLERFLKSEIAEAEDDETEARRASIQDVNHKLLACVNGIPELPSTDISRFSQATKMLPQFQKFVAGSDVFVKNAFTFRTPKPLTRQAQGSKRPMQPGGVEWARHIIANRSRCDQRDVTEARKVIDDFVAKSRAAHEKTPRPARKIVARG